MRTTRTPRSPMPSSHGRSPLAGRGHLAGLVARDRGPEVDARPEARSKPRGATARGTGRRRGRAAAARRRWPARRRTTRRRARERRADRHEHAHANASARNRRRGRAPGRSSPHDRTDLGGEPGWRTQTDREDTVEGDGYAVGHLDGLGEGWGFRKVRKGLGATAFGANAIVMPPRATRPGGTSTSARRSSTSSPGAMAIEFGDGRARPRRGRPGLGGAGHRAPHPQPGRGRPRLPGGRRRGRLRRPRRRAGRGREPRRRLARPGLTRSQQARRSVCIETTDAHVTGPSARASAAPLEFRSNQGLSRGGQPCGRPAVAGDPGGRDLRAGRPLGLRQDDRHADGQPADRDLVGRHPARRPERQGPQAGRAAPRHRLRDPADRPVPALDDRPEHRHRPAPARLGQAAGERASTSCST